MEKPGDSGSKAGWQSSLWRRVKNLKAGIVHIVLVVFIGHMRLLYPGSDYCNVMGQANWGICGIALLDTDSKIFNCFSGSGWFLVHNDYESDGTLMQGLLDLIIEYLFASEIPDAVIEKIADPDIKIITLTYYGGRL